MGGHIIIRNEVRLVLSKPLHLAALPTDKRQAVEDILARTGDQWTSQDCGVLANAIDWLLCNFPHS